MSNRLEGKIANQLYFNPSKRYDNNPNITYDSWYNAYCSCCNKHIPSPEEGTITLPKNNDNRERILYVYNYLDTPYYIYESKSGVSVVYCSDECRRKHNHRFTKYIPPKKKTKNKNLEREVMCLNAKIKNIKYWLKYINDTCNLR